MKVKQSFESSSTLLAQIQQGAPADVFASAAEEEMNTAVKEGLVKGAPEVFVAAPFYVRQAATGFGAVDRAVEEAAMVDGAGHWRRFFRVTIPLALPALVAGALTAWARALGEFGATIIFAGSFRGVTQTIPLAIFAEFQRDLDAAVALSVLVLGFAFAVILAVRYLTARSTGDRA